MVSLTPNRGYRYPECDPPEVKDASDIADLRDLAEDVNADADALEARILDFIEQPDAARLSFAGNQFVPNLPGDFIFTVVYDTVTYDNTAGLYDSTFGGLRIIERGLYMVTSYVRLTSVVNTVGDLGVAHLRNGSFGGRRFEGPSGDINTGGATGDTAMTTSDILICNAGDTIQTHCVIIALSDNYAMEARLSITQIHKLDV